MPGGRVEGLEAQKRRAALAALAHVESGMTLGLGSGSTATYAIVALGQALHEGTLQDIVGVPTSHASKTLAHKLGIPLVDLGEAGVDLAIDGMDEVTPTLDAIKGLGGALLREKVVAARARRFILIGDARKQVARLGESVPVPVEVAPFAWRAIQKDIEALGCTAPPRHAASQAAPLFVTDNGNTILDCTFPEPFDAPHLAERLRAIPGVLEHGLFLGMAHLAYIATDETVLELHRP